MNIAYNMDCMEYMRTLPDGIIDLTVTSPPYDNLRTYKGYVFEWKATIKEIYRVTKVGGVCVWIVADQTINGSESGTSFKQALWAKECGFNLHDTMIWKKESCTFPDKTRYYPNFEFMFIFSKGQPKTFNPICDRPNKCAGKPIHGTCRQPDGTLKPRSAKHKVKKCAAEGCRFNVWEITTEKNNKTGHPAVFPYALARDHIISWSNPKEIIFDPFLGSGTTRLAAYDTDRQFLGCEIDVDYFKAQEARYLNHIAQGNLFVDNPTVTS